MRFPSLSLCLLALTAPAFAGDWSHWRGPTYDGVSPEKDLPETFEVDKPGQDNLVWKAPYGCRSAPLILGDRIYFNSHISKGPKADERILEQERVLCLDAKTGKLIWKYDFNVFLTDIVSSRVGWTNLAADPATGNIYCHGTQGLLICFDRDGKILWERSLTEEFGRVSGYGGRLTSPLVDGDHVLISMACAAWGEYGRGGCRLIAFDKKTGQIAWWGSTGLRVRDTYQSTPIAAQVGGQRLVITGAGDGGVHAFKANTGEKVWSYVFCSGAINCTPIVEDGKVYIAHGDLNPDNPEKQGRIVCLDGAEVKDGQPKVIWQVEGAKIKFASPVLHDGRLIFNGEDARLYCLDAKDGKMLWRFKYGSGSNVRCSPVLADGKIYIGDSRSRFYVIKDDKKKPKELHELYLPSATPGANSELDGSASVAQGCVYFASNDFIYCVSKSGFKTTPNAPNGAAKEDPPESNARPAHLQVIPADVTLSPGESASFKARLFDDRGRFLREVKAEWSLGPMLGVEPVVGLPPPPKINPPPLRGKLTENGKLTVPGELQGQFGNVVARAEGVTGHARVRQVAKLPYKQDFEKTPAGGVPGGWVNSQVKFQVRKVGETNVLVKTSTNPSPLVARGNAFIGLPTWKDYTIEAEMLGTKLGDEIPDMGVVANRYTFFLSGNAQQLRLISWDGLLRVDRSIGYSWKPNEWYHLKLSVVCEGDKAVVRGKIWPRGDKEPEKWAVEVDDPIGNKEGAPALYANIPPTSIKPGKSGCEVFFDNVVITPNKTDKRSGLAPKPAPKPELKPAIEPAVVETATIIDIVPCERFSTRGRLLPRWRR